MLRWYKVERDPKEISYGELVSTVVQSHNEHGARVNAMISNPCIMHGPKFGQQDRSWLQSKVTQLDANGDNLAAHSAGRGPSLTGVNGEEPFESARRSNHNGILDSCSFCNRDFPEGMLDTTLRTTIEGDVEVVLLCPDHVGVRK